MLKNLVKRKLKEMEINLKKVKMYLVKNTPGKKDPIGEVNSLRKVDTLSVSVCDVYSVKSCNNL